MSWVKKIKNEWQRQGDYDYDHRPLPINETLIYNIKNDRKTQIFLGVFSLLFIAGGIYGCAGYAYKIEHGENVGWMGENGEVFIHGEGMKYNDFAKHMRKYSDNQNYCNDSDLDEYF